MACSLKKRRSESTSDVTRSIRSPVAAQYSRADGEVERERDDEVREGRAAAQDQPFPHLLETWRVKAAHLGSTSLGSIRACSIPRSGEPPGDAGPARGDGGRVAHCSSDGRFGLTGEAFDYESKVWGEQDVSTDPTTLGALRP